MNKKEEFKTFVKEHPELISFIKNKEMTWQQFYEIYDIYGNDESTWDKYFSKANETNQNMTNNFNSIKQMVKSIDMDSVQKHINTAQKALGVIEELTTKSSNVASTIKGPLNPRPLTKFFED